MEMNPETKKLKDAVMSIPVGQALDEAVAQEVYKVTKSKEPRPVKDIFTNDDIGKSVWATKEGKPTFLPKFSTVAFIGCLMLEDLDVLATIERKGIGNFVVTFNGECSGIPMEGTTLAEAIARAALFEERLKEIGAGNG